MERITFVLIVEGVTSKNAGITSIQPSIPTTYLAHPNAILHFKVTRTIRAGNGEGNITTAYVVCLRQVRFRIVSLYGTAVVSVSFNVAKALIPIPVVKNIIAMGVATRITLADLSIGYKKVKTVADVHFPKDLH